MEGTKQPDLQDFAAFSVEKALSYLKTKESGLSPESASDRLRQYGPNSFTTKDRTGVFLKLIFKFASPLVILLFAVAGLSYFFGEKTSAVIIIAMAVMSVILSFVQEHHASKNAEKLRALVKISAVVIRAGKKFPVPLHDIVPGDIVELEPGKMVPADVRIISANDLFVSQSSLNGESFPEKKTPETEKPHEHRSVFDLSSVAFMGSNVVSGYGLGIVIATGKNTEFGKLSKAITKVEIETGFDKGIRNFTWLMIRLIVILSVFIFFVNALVKGNVIEALLFALAVAVGLAPEMLPMIVTVNLSKGAIGMSKKKVIIKELESIQNFGAMDVLCTDKTGTLTQDRIVLVNHCNVDGDEDDSVLLAAYTNSSLQSSAENVMDKAVLNHKKFSLKGVKKLNEIPFDFERKSVSVITEQNGVYKIISKGAPEEIIHRASKFSRDKKSHEMTIEMRRKLLKKFDDMSRDGFRVLAVATREIQKKESYSVTDEKELVFLGFVAFLDPPKPTAEEAIVQLEKLGIKLKVLSGDNELVTRKICQEVKIEIAGVLSGHQIENLSDFTLDQVIDKTNVFVRLTPLQKQRIILSLKRKGHVVGFLGDGINDAPALKSADVGISVNNATDIAKETAQIILLEKNLMVLSDCVVEGRKTFANVTKYIKMGASSNFGNMLSMTGASIFLPFLPMLPTQILLNNFLYDLSQTAIPTDSVDDDYLLKPRPWNVGFIKEFIIYIGPISSIFDFITFGVMWYVFHASPELFHTGWFVESLLTQILVVHVIRTNKIPFIESRPSNALLYTTLGILAFAIILPYTTFAKTIGFVALPLSFFGILLLIAMTYLLLVQLAKTWFIKKFGYE